MKELFGAVFPLEAELLMVRVSNGETGGRMSSLPVVMVTLKTRSKTERNAELCREPQHASTSLL